MKRSSLLLLVMISAGAAMAQRVDLDRFSFATSYRDLPASPLDSQYKTYSVVLETGPVMKLNCHPEDIEQQVVIDGWKQLPYGGHIQVAIKMEDVVIEQNQAVAVEKILRDKNGKEIGKEVSYQVQSIYSYVARLRVTDYKGNVLQQRDIQTRDRKGTFTTSSFATEGEAKTFIRYGTMQLLNDLNKRMAYSVTGGLGSELTTLYGFPVRQVGDFFWVLNNRKHAEFDGHQRAWIAFQQAVTSLNANESSTEARKAMQPVIDYYNKVKKMYPGDDKNSRKLRYASCFNLSKIYYYLDMPDMAMQEAGELKITGYDTRDGDRLLASATGLKQQMRQARMNSRHFNLPVETFRGPESMSRRDDF
jgi:hypothetical protein